MYNRMIQKWRHELWNLKIALVIQLIQLVRLLLIGGSLYSVLLITFLIQISHLIQYVLAATHKWLTFVILTKLVELMSLQP